MEQQKEKNSAKEYFQFGELTGYFLGRKTRKEKAILT
jgi:hypothetical protein